VKLFGRRVGGKLYNSLIFLNDEITIHNSGKIQNIIKNIIIIHFNTLIKLDLIIEFFLPY
jgi:hypothetical protein